jgi:hypothetical protein
MKKILAGTLSLVLFFGAAQAQDTTKHFRGGKERVAQQLNLTADQQKKMQAIQKDQRKEMKALHDKYQNQRQAILTPDQKQKFETLKAERKQQMKGKMAKRHGQMKKHMAMKKNAEVQKQLNLSQTQKDQLAKMRTDVKGKMQSIRNDQSLSQDQKKEKMKSLKKEQHEKFKSVLSKDQLDKLQSLKKDHPAKNTK